MHEYAGCITPDCQRCHDYEHGYQSGKAKVHEELRTRTLHAERCGCELCKTARAIVCAPGGAS